MSPTTQSQAKLAAVALAAGLALTAFGSGDARAQALKVVTFECADSFEVDVDIRGLGNTNVCVAGTATLNLDCACVGGGGNCPTDTKKQGFSTTISVDQTLEPKNGRLDTSVSLPGTPPTDAQCAAALSCPNGQRSRLIQFDTEPDGTHFEACTTTAAVGEACTCDGQGTLLANTDCPATSEVSFPGKHDSCLALFQ
jgi:hypothetical protein